MLSIIPLSQHNAARGGETLFILIIINALCPPFQSPTLDSIACRCDFSALYVVDNRSLEFVVNFEMHPNETKGLLVAY